MLVDVMARNHRAVCGKEQGHTLTLSLCVPDAFVCASAMEFLLMPEKKAVRGRRTVVDCFAVPVELIVDPPNVALPESFGSGL